ncbi:hypothetical protein ACFB49_13630 [Sphingomonas sp. DBB INV C78]|uniref:hypothetical protein n=1 Tax=Sphingomonas sp. DBB INV C78 TaxID=3349434 RepID=UPI0036D27F80
MSMNQGARSTDQWREHRALLEAISRNREEGGVGMPTEEPAAPPPTTAQPAPLVAEMEPAEIGTPWRDIVIGGALLVIGALWIAAVATTLEAQGSPLSGLTAIVSLASGPLALLGVLFLVLQRTSRREAVRFGQTAQAMRVESINLELAVAQLAGRIAESRRELTDHTEQLLNVGQDSTLRLGELAAAMARESKALRVESDHLETTAEIARSDMGVLIDDLPRVEEQVRSLIHRLREVAGEADGRLTTLTGQLTALAEQGEKADAVAAGAAQQLATQLAAIDRHGNAADERIEALTGRITARDQNNQAFLEGVDRSIADIEARIASLGTKGGDTARELGEALVQLRDQSDSLTDRLAAAAPATEALVERATALKAALDASTTGLGEQLPAALASVEAQAERSQTAIAAMMPEAEALQQAVSNATGNIADVEKAITDQRTALDAIQASAAGRLAEIRTQATELQASIAEAEQSARTLADQAGPQLVEALLRVRETAVQAAERARESIGTVIPNAAASLGTATREAIEKAINETLATQLGDINATAERAVAAATAASERLQNQLAAIKDTAATVDARVDEVHSQVAEHDEESFSRRVALLIESLNSTSIDVAKILSNDVTDSAWTSYLKGDRSVFTRRAVRLLDAAETKEITRHYEEEAEFRDQVNRYIHDFEAMLRRVLSSRDGAPLSVTLLSSDMGKLYVALAQAIERLRT